MEEAPATTSYEWQGTDEYSDLEDRKDAPPLPLPGLKAPRRVVLVRHGQSTWNAEGRIQGSCNASELTDKGKSQAETTEDLVGFLHPHGGQKLAVALTAPVYSVSVTKLCLWT